MTKKAYQALQLALKPYGIVIQESTSRGTLDKLFLWASKLGVYPNAITVGVMAKVSEWHWWIFWLPVQFFC